MTADIIVDGNQQNSIKIQLVKAEIENIKFT